MVGAALASAATAAPVTLPIGTAVALRTVETLSSRKSAKGDPVKLETTKDVLVGGRVAVAKGTPATGQITEMRAKGAMGMSGRLSIRPLYLRVGDATVRLAGAVSKKSSVDAGAVVGMVALGAPMFTGRSAEVAAGTPVDAVVEKTVLVESTPGN